MAYTTIDDPSEYFQTTIYTGNGGSQDIANGGNSDLQPDWLWLKQRSGAAGVSSHVVKDSSRGVTKEVYPNAVTTEGTNSLIDGLLSDGFSINNTANDHYNYGNALYASWQWKANGGTRTTYNESGNNPAGGYQVNTTAGFSIIDYTGTGGAGGTIAHGLGAVPHAILIKCRNTAHDWCVYHHKNTAAPETDHLVLNETAATTDGLNKWNDTVPDSTNITLGDGGGVNANDQTHIAYVFTEKQGYSKFGTLTGNANADGPFVHLGFKPAWIMYKVNSTTDDWMIFDSKRIHSSTQHDYLEPNTTDAEGFIAVTFLSNGFKITEASGAKFNASGATYIYMAFAEHPFVSSKGIPVTGSSLGL